jgi:hypothetical protein
LDESKRRMKNWVLNPIFDEIKCSLSIFNSACFAHVYKEFNGEVDPLSKE